jgi:hypothetical protein
MMSWNGEANHFDVGDEVLVIGPPGELIGKVLHVATPDQMPDLPDMPAGPAKESMREWGIDLLLLIAHQHAGADVMFMALHHPGGWRDLRAGS